MTAHIAIYAGSFDPITTGHLDVVKRARGMFDKVILGIGQNPDKQSLLPCEKRVSLATTLVEELVSEAPDLAPVEVTPYEGLTVDFAKASGAAALIRGIRNVTDLAAETQLAITNRQVADIETVFIVTGEMYALDALVLEQRRLQLRWFALVLEAVDHTFRGCAHVAGINQHLT